jgi:hypothetical protein
MQIIVLKFDRQRSSNHRLQSSGSFLCSSLPMESLCCQLNLRYNVLYPSKSGADCQNNENNRTNNVHNSVETDAPVALCSSNTPF